QVVSMLSRPAHRLVPGRDLALGHGLAELRHQHVHDVPVFRRVGKAALDTARPTGRAAGKRRVPTRSDTAPRGHGASELHAIVEGAAERAFAHPTNSCMAATSSARCTASRGTP